jgi:hypothetical protein
MRRLGARRFSNKMKEDYNQGNAHGNDDVVYGHGVKGTNSNITKRC